MLRRLLIVAAVLLALLVVVDRIAVVAADRVVAARLQAQENLSTRPSVSIGGFPFLTQAISGTYSDVTVTLHDVHRSVVRIDTITVHLHGVHVPLHAVLSQHLPTVRIDSGTAVTLLTYADLNAYLQPKGLTLASGGGSSVRATGSAVVAGQRVSATGDAALSLVGQSVQVKVGGFVVATVPLSGLPFSIHLDSVRAAKQGILVAGSAEQVVVHPRG